MKSIRLRFTFALLALAGGITQAAPLGTAFNYQGRLDDNGQPATGIYQMNFALFVASSGGSPLASNNVPVVPVTNGLFHTSLDFGATAFAGEERWLQTTVRTNNNALPFVLLSPRTRLAPTPNTIYASVAGMANTVAGNGSSYLRLNDLYLGTDASHGIGYRTTYAGASNSIDGPVLFGYSGGGLGSTVPDVLALTWNRQGNVSAQRNLSTASLDVRSGPTYLHHNNLYFGTDASHGVGYRSTYTSASIDGPVLFGYGGGGLGSTVPDALALTWTWEGDVWVRRHLSTCSLTIRGGCDLAEPFPMKEETIEKGSVVIIDEEHPGRLKLSTRAYDTQVAGIVSGANGINPGISLTQEGALDQGQNVALTGRVYVQADASHGAIKPGDLLTTSDTPGHAMKVSDSTRAQGAILGKAMGSLEKGTGLVLVLVTLQ